MSVNRENEIWQSADGTWSRGFYAHYNVGDTSDPEWDHEWDVEYEDYFWTVTTGHPTEDAAWRAWTGANPGGASILSYDEGSAAECARLDAMAQEVKNKGTLYRGWWSI